MYAALICIRINAQKQPAISQLFYHPKTTWLHRVLLHLAMVAGGAERQHVHLSISSYVVQIYETQKCKHEEFHTEPITYAGD